MTAFLKVFNLFAYVFLISPPRALELKRHAKRHAGELANVPVIIIVLTDLLVRVSCLAIFAWGFESLIGDNLYESYRFDLVFLAIVLLGAGHSAVYYFLLALGSKWFGFRAKAYRLFRNLFYSPLPTLALIIPVVIFEKFRGLEAYGSAVWQDYAPYVLGITLLVGVVEAGLGRRLPLGIDVEL